MSATDITETVSDTSARFLGVGAGPQFLSLFKGFTLTTIVPIILIVIFTVIVVNILAYLVADSPGHHHYPHYGKQLAVAAADLWDKRGELGFPAGRTLDSLGPLERVLDAIAISIKKYENSELSEKIEKKAKFSNPSRLDLSSSASSNFIQGNPQFITKPSSFHNRGQIGEVTGKVRFE
ncbi:UNVERIFIED_CONTAM: hypothetical protein RMT77_005197 [Armadillidium vulgare]